MLKLKLSDKRIYGGILAILSIIYASIYLPYVISPQFGWWQYYAWRMQEGDILYKDIYLFLPPYFVFLTHQLFQIFDNHFILYTYLVGVPVKLLCILLMYHVVCKITKPIYAAIAVFTSLCLSTSYPMDMWYDFNPIIMLPSIGVAWLFMSYYEQIHIKQECSYWRMFLIGLLTMVILCMKQTFGLGFLFAIGGGLIIIYAKEYQGKNNRFLVSILYFIVGAIVGLFPCICYMTAHHCWKEFFQCIWSIKAAKGGDEKIFLRIPFVFHHLPAWTALILTLVGGYLGRQKHTPKDISTSKKRNTIGSYTIFLVALGTYMVVYSWLPVPFHHSFYESVDTINLHFAIIYYLTYGSFVIWLYHFYRYMTNREEGTPILVFGTMLIAHFLLGVLSADGLENIYMLFYCPWILALFFNYTTINLKLKNSIVVIYCLSIISLAISTKIACPYSWQGWRQPDICQEEIFSTVPGLEGHKMPKDVNNAFNTIVHLIQQNCTQDDDQVYSFSNILLFNILTKTQIPGYTPVSWFDVCPDANAIQIANEISMRPPKVIIWNDMDDRNWNMVEMVFRGGNKSGQQQIKQVFDNMVKDQIYHCAYTTNNHRDGEIQVWVRNSN